MMPSASIHDSRHIAAPAVARPAVDCLATVQAIASSIRGAFESTDGNGQNSHPSWQFLYPINTLGDIGFLFNGICGTKLGADTSLARYCAVADLVAIPPIRWGGIGLGTPRANCAELGIFTVCYMARNPIDSFSDITYCELTGPNKGAGHAWTELTCGGDKYVIDTWFGQAYKCDQLLSDGHCVYRNAGDNPQLCAPTIPLGLPQTNADVCATYSGAAASCCLTCANTPGSTGFNYNTQGLGYFTGNGSCDCMVPPPPIANCNGIANSGEQQCCQRCINAGGATGYSYTSTLVSSSCVCPYSVCNGISNSRQWTCCNSCAEQHAGGYSYQPWSFGPTCTCQ
jgi:hypothetical protein